MAEKKRTHHTLSVPDTTHKLLCGIALHAGPDVGRRLALHEIVSAALAIAEQHHEELKAILTGDRPGPTMPTTQAGTEVPA